MTQTVAQAQHRKVSASVKALLSEPDAEKRAEMLAGLSPHMRLEVLRSLVSSMPEDRKAEMARLTEQLAQRWAPESDEQLWEMFRDECGIEIPRVAVCEGHCAPFEFAADVYFERGLPDKLAIGNRGSGKTNIMGALHALNARTKPGHEGTTVGSVLSQSERCYSYVSAIAKRWGKTVVAKVQMKETKFVNGSLVSIITGTLTGVNSPHPHVAHFDEIELFREGVYEEALNMAQGGNGYRAMNVGTSSWKKTRGFVSELIGLVDEAMRDGNTPPYEVYRWCVFETTKQCPHECAECPFRTTVKGQWEDGTTRTFEDVCKGWNGDASRRSNPDVEGKLKRARGFVTLEDAVSRFRKLSRRMWESQQESRKPSTEGLVYDTWDEDDFSVWDWDPDPDLGPITLHADFGGTNPFAIGFWQQLRVAVTHNGRTIPEGAHILFDEVYRKDIGNVEAGRLTNERILFWEGIHPGFRGKIEGVYRDVAARAAGMDWAKLSSYGEPGDPLMFDLPTRAIGGISIEQGVAMIYEAIIGKGLLWVDRKRCPEFLIEVGSYEKDPRTGIPFKRDDHHMDGMRYRFWQLHLLERKNKAPTYGPMAGDPQRAVLMAGGQIKWDQEHEARPMQRGVSVMVALERKNGIGMR